MLQRIREGLTIVLLALLPLHAFLVTVGTRLIAGPDHAPLAMLALWKESLLVIILILAFVEWVMQTRQRGHWSLVTGHWDVIDALIGGLFILSLIVTAATHADWGLYAIGFKYDLLPLLVFMVLRRLSWSEAFLHRATVSIALSAGLVVLYGIASLALPIEVFTWLGYSEMHSLYRPDAPLPAFHQIGGVSIRRVQSTFAGPNQMSLWLLLPLGLLLARASFQQGLPLINRRRFAGAVLLGIALALSLSRSAWIAGLVMVAFWGALSLKRQMFVRLGAVAVTAMIIAVGFGLSFAPDLLLRAASTRDHLDRPLQALSQMIVHPFGQGLGTAGPASNRVSDACIYLEEDDDAAWAVGRDDLCVFVGSIQAQPVGRSCHCAFLPENWYLQIGVELGWLGMLLYIALIIVIIRRLFGHWSLVTGHSSSVTVHSSLAPSIFLAVLGVSIAALFLHAWEDSAVAYSLWILAAAVLPVRGSIPPSSVVGQAPNP